MPTTHGPVRAIVYRHAPPAGQPEPLTVPMQDEHLALLIGEGEPAGESGVLCRVHSECWTGETLGSKKCDCREQLDAALDAMAARGRGIVVYLRQEGRGIGLGNKIRAYALQNAGADTVEANQALGFEPDLRSYDLAAAILADLKVQSVELLTNNPDKLRELEQAGVRVSARVPHWVEGSDESRDYLQVKRDKLGHTA